MARIGVLNFGNPEPLWTMLQDGMQELRYRAGQNLQFDFRLAGGNSDLLPGDLLPGLAAELFRLKPDATVGALEPWLGGDLA
jgi:hypothetical protein